MISSAAARATVAIVAAAVAAPWLGWTAFAYRHGMETIDTLWYHMPFTARFVQSGSILGLHYVDANAIIPFYPANSELLHALGLAAFSSDWLSPLITLGWAALAVLAAWALGRPFGRHQLSVVAVLAVLGTTDLISSQPGGAYNDVVCLALLLSAAALLVHGTGRTGSSFVAALAIGLAAGAKVTMIVPAVVLAIGAVVTAPAGSRWRQLGIWVAGTTATGGYWYVRNLLHNGNPLGSVHLGLGPVALPSPRTPPLHSIAGYLTDGHAWSTDFLPGLRSAFGPVWWLLLGLVAAGTLASLRRDCRPVIRVLAWTAVISIIAVVLAPQQGEPGSFRYNLRYETPPMALGLVLLTLHPRLQTRRVHFALLGLLAGASLLGLLDGAIWPTQIGSQLLSTPLSGAPAVAGAVLAGVAAIVWILAARVQITVEARAWIRSIPVIAAAVLALAGGGLAVARSYSTHRYRDLQPLPRTFAWAQSLHHTRIAIAGLFDQYALYGSDSSNYVQFIGEPGPHAGFSPVTSCRRWRTLVNAGHYAWLVEAPPGFPLTLAGDPELPWTTPPTTTRLFIERPPGAPASDAVTVFRVRGHMDPATCPH